MQRILVVEDDPAMREHLLHLLSEIRGVEVDAASNEEEARTFMGESNYDLAVLDIELGQTALSRFAGFKLATEKPATVALFVSGTSDATVRSLASYLCNYDFVGKPFDDIDFIGKVNRSLEVARLAQSNVPTTKSALPPGLERNPKNQTKFLWQGKDVQLSVTELGIVDQLARSFGSVVPYTTLETVMPSGRGPNAVSSHIRNIRQAFRDKDPGFIEIAAEPGRGYIWNPRGQG